jgi:hypothetical protein
MASAGEPAGGRLTTAGPATLERPAPVHRKMIAAKSLVLQLTGATTPP